jgi:Flp pilus assembly protein TadG
MSEQGSATTELVILAPLLVVLAVSALILGRLVLYQEQVADAARSAVEAAALWPTAPQADEAALLTASYDLVHDDARCVRSSVSVETADLQPGGQIHATVTCVVLVGSSLLPGVPGAMTINASASAPIETYREVG